MGERPGKRKRVAIIGAGPGGLAAALILAHRGFDVSVFEKQKTVGGRNGAIKSHGYKFDIGPTFLMMKFLLDTIFHEAELRSESYLQFVKLDPMYQLRFADRIINPGNDPETTKAQIEKYFPGRGAGFDQFMAHEKARFQRIIPCLQRDYSSLSRLLSLTLMKSVPYLSLGKSVFQVLKSYFSDDDLAILFGFQSKYLGMSAWKCPGGFTMLPYIEHAYGVYHTMGGLSEISQALATAAQDCGARIYLDTAVQKLWLDGLQVKGVTLASGEHIASDAVVINADFAHAMTHLVPEHTLKKYSASKLDRMQVSCSTFMMHLGVKRTLDLPHHTIVFANNYKGNVQEVFEQQQLSEDFSFYIRNASVTDPSLAPKGKSSLYILVPVPNLMSGHCWSEIQQTYRDQILTSICQRLGIADLTGDIEYEQIVTPQAWHDDYDVYKGATFNLAHNLSQMAYWRPRNRFEELKNCYLVGGGTHPGSGLPTIFESARISSNLLCQQFAVPYRTVEIQIP